MTDRVIIELDGLMLERLMMRALDDGAQFSRVIRLSRRRISVSCGMKSARLLMRLAEKYHIVHHVVEIRGVVMVLQKARRRATLAAAFAMMALLSGYFLSHVWSVDIALLRGNSMPDGVRETLHEAGIFAGAYGKTVDTALAALKLTALDGCAHASVRRDGISVIAEIACEEPAPGLYELANSRDLVAVCDGVISSVNVKSGTAMVAPGDTVKKGQVLISGYERAGKEEFADLGALGSVTARIWYDGAEIGYIYTMEKRFTGRESTGMRVVTPWLTWPLIGGEVYENCESAVSRTPIGGLFIPLYVEKTVRREFELVSAEHDVNELKLTLEAASYAAAQANAAENAPENAEIIDKWTDFSMIESEDIIHARTVIELEAEIAVTRGYLEGY